MPELPPALTALAVPYLERQLWYHRAITDEPAAPLELVSFGQLAEGPPGLARLLLGRGELRFQLLVGWRPAANAAEVLKGTEGSLLGSVEVDGAHVLAYDALADDELLIELLRVVTEDKERANRVRRVSTLVSHASLVFDERLFMKVYRVLEEGQRPEAEVMFRLDAVGFNALLAPIARWRANGYDLALVREFMPSALEGRLLALTSLRDLLAHASSDEQTGEYDLGEIHSVETETATAGGDLASEMRRLGAMSAAMHAALNTAFGARPTEPAALVQILESVSELGPARSERDGEFAAIAAAVAQVDRRGAGMSIRLHGDYHLRRVMRAEAGWVVAGFSDDPLYAAARRGPSLAPRFGSPVEDIADMWFSMHRVADEALAQRPSSEADRATRLASAWKRRNRDAFLEGYVTSSGARMLLPSDPATTELLLRGFELVRERRYEATPSEE